MAAVTSLLSQKDEEEYDLEIKDSCQKRLMQEVAEAFGKHGHTLLPPCLVLRAPSMKAVVGGGAEKQKISGADEGHRLSAIAESTGNLCSVSLRGKRGDALVVVASSCTCSAYLHRLECGHIVALVRAWLSDGKQFYCVESVRTGDHRWAIERGAMAYLRAPPKQTQELVRAILEGDRGVAHADAARSSSSGARAKGVVSGAQSAGARTIAPADAARDEYS